MASLLHERTSASARWRWRSHSRRIARGALACLIAALACCGGLAHAQTNGTWTTTGAGTYTWSDGANWSGGTVASGTDATAAFSTVPTGTVLVTITGTQTIGAITAAAGNSYIDLCYEITGGTLNLDRGGARPVISQNNALGKFQISSGITGTSGVEFTGAGWKFFAGTNKTYTGDTVISGGNLDIGNGAAGGLLGDGNYAGNISLTGGNLRFNSTSNQTFSGTVSGAGTLTKTSSGTLTLTAANTYTGLTQINAGQLSLSGGDNRLAATAAITIIGGVLDLGGFSQTTSGAISFRGGTVQSGTLNKSGAAFDGRAGTVSAVLAGSVGLTKIASGTATSGTLTLTGANTYSGTTAINAGVLQIGNSGTTGGLASSSAITGSSGATLAFNRTDNYGGDFTNAISGDLGVRVNSGTLTLSAANAYTGTTAIYAGVLVANNAAALGTMGTVMFGGGTLQYGSGITTDLSGRIASSGSAISVDTNGNDVTWATGLASTNTGGLTKRGAGTLSLSGSNSLGGTTAVNAGTLEVATGGWLNAPIQINGGALAIAGGTVSNSLASFNHNGTIRITSGSYAQSTNILSANLTWDQSGGNATLTGQQNFGQNAGHNSQMTISGGTLTSTGGAFFVGASGTGTLTMSGGGAASFSSLRLGFSGGASTVNLNGGTTTISALAAAPGSRVLNLNGGTLKAGASFTIPSGITTNVNSGGAVFDATGFTITGSSALTNGGGGGGLTLQGGTLTLSASNSYTGGSTISAGRLVVSNSAALGASSGALAVNGGTLDLGGFSVNVAALSGSSGAVITTNNAVTARLTSNFDSGTSTFAGTIQNNGSGLVALWKSGAGTLRLSGSSSLTATSEVNGGTLEVATGGWLDAPIRINGGTLAIAGGTVSNSLSSAGLNGTIRITSGSYAQTANILSANLTWDQSGGNATLTGQQNFGQNAGNNSQMTISGGTLTSTGTFFLSVFASSTATLTMDGGAASFSDLRLGSSGGASTVNLNGGTTTISALAAAAGSRVLNLDGGTLKAGASFAIPISITTNVNSGGAVFDATGFTITANSALTDGGGGGGLTLQGGTLTLSASNSYTGGSTISAGRLVVSNSAALGASSGALAVNGGTLDLGGFSVNVAALSGSSGAVITTNNAGTVRLTSNFDSGTSTFAGTIQNNGSGLVALTKSGAGTLRLSGSNSFTGTSDVNGGTLEVATGGWLNQPIRITGGTLAIAGGTVSNSLNNAGLNGTIRITSGSYAQTANMLSSNLTWDQSGGNATLTGQQNFGQSAGNNSQMTISGGTFESSGGAFYLGVSGTATLTMSGGGAASFSNLILGFGGGASTVNLNGGTTTISALAAAAGSRVLNLDGGTLKAGASFAIPISITTNVNSGGAVFDATGFTITANSALTDGGGGGGLTLQGGTLALGADNTFTGATDVNAGTLAFNRLAALNSSSGINVAAGAILDYTGGAGTLSRNVTVSSSGTGTIRNSGGQALTLSGTLTKDGRVLRLTGGAFNVTGQIVGASDNSDLLVDGTSTVTLSSANTYNGPTFVNQASTLIVGINDAIPNNSTVTLGDETSAGTLDLGTFTNQIGGLVFDVGGGTVRMAANQTASPQLSTTSALSLGSNASLDLTGMQTSAGNYRLISSTGLSGTFGSVTGLNSNYVLRYGTVNANEISAQRKAEFGTVAATPAAATIITGGSTSIGYTVANLAPTDGSTLSFTSSNGANVAGSSNGTAIAGGTSASISGLVFTGTSVGLNQTGSFTLTDPNAISTTANGSVSVNVLNHSLASFASTDTATKTLDFGTYDAGSWSGGDGGNGTLEYFVFNIASLGFDNAETAGLNLYEWAHASGDDVFSVGFSSFANLAAGSSNGLFATVVSPGSLAEGSYTGTYTLKFRDQQDLSGATNTRNLTLTTTVIVVPEPGAIALAAIGIAAAAWARRRCYKK